MLTFGMTTNKSGVAILMPRVNVLDIVHNVRRAPELSHTNRIRQSLIAYAVDALRFTQQEKDVFEWFGLDD